MISPSRVMLLIATCTAFGCASTNDAPVAASQTEASKVEPRQSVSAPTVRETIQERLSDEITVSEEREKRIGRMQDAVFGLVQGAATTVDSFFGTAEGDTQATVSRGRLSVGGQYDDFDGLDGRVRFNARVTLPTAKQRTRLILQRGDADDAIAGSQETETPSLPTQFSDIDDTDWLFGLGYARDRELRRGWSLGAGLSFSPPVAPYVRATYKVHRGFGDDWLVTLRPRIYWQGDRGAGWSISNTIDWAPYDKWLYRLYSIALDDDRTEGVRWTTKALNYYSLSKKSAFSTGLYARGETDAEIQVQDVGVEFRHRRQISRNYLFVEFLTYLSVPREELVQDRKLTPGIGIEFELQFGQWPGREKPSVRRPGASTMRAPHAPANEHRSTFATLSAPMRSIGAPRPPR